MAVAAKTPEQEATAAEAEVVQVDPAKLERELLHAVRETAKHKVEIVEKAAYKRVMSSEGELLVYVRRGKKGLLLQLEVPVKADDQLEQAIAIVRAVAESRGVAVK